MIALGILKRSVTNVRACESEPEPEPRAYFASHRVVFVVFFFFFGFFFCFFFFEFLI